MHLKQQQLINFLPYDSSIGTNQSGFVSALHNGKFDMLKMREEMDSRCMSILSLW